MRATCDAQAYRDGLEIRNDAKATKERIAESEKRVDTKLGEQISKKYWYGSDTFSIYFLKNVILKDKIV